MVCCGQSPAEAGDSESITDEDCDNYSNDGHGHDDKEISDIDSRVPNDDGSICQKTRPTVAFNKLKKLFNKSEFEKRFRVVTNAAR
jgi:hypothetical protein